MPSEIGLSSLVWSTDSKILLQESLNFSSASTCVLHSGAIPSNYQLLVPDKQLQKSQSPETGNDDGSVYDESSTTSSSPLSYTKELTNVSSPLTPLSDARRSKSKSPSHLVAHVSKFLVDDEYEALQKTPENCKNTNNSDNIKNGCKADLFENSANIGPSTSEEFIGPVMPPMKSVSPKTVNGFSEKTKKTTNGIFTNSNVIKPKMMTIKIGKETIAKKELTTARSISSPLVPYGEESSDDELNNNGDGKPFKQPTPAKERPISPHTIIGPLKPSKYSLLSEQKTGLMQKRVAENTPSPPVLKRKRLLSERGEKEMAYPIMDKSTISAWNWSGCQNIIGRTRGSGLFNSSNDCFLNAILQVITHTAPLCRYLIERHHDSMCLRGTNNCVACGLKISHLKRSLSTYNTLYTNWIRPHLRRIFPSHIHGMQEDAHELLALLLDAIDPPVSHNKNNNVISGVNTKPSTPIEQIFGGTLRNQVTCDVCRSVYTNYERIRELNLAIKKTRPDADHAKISFLIDNYFKDEVVASFDCKKCVKKTSATRKTKILRPPAVLLVQLKRFNAFGQKIRLPVTPEIDVDLTKYLSEAAPTTCTEYVLTSIVEHLGTTVDHGHYVAYCRGFDHKQWYLFDDDTVTGVSGQKVMQSNPYLLVYSRREDMPFNSTKKAETGIYKPHASFSTHKTNGFTSKINGYNENGNFNRSKYMYNLI